MRHCARADWAPQSIRHKARLPYSVEIRETRIGEYPSFAWTIAWRRRARMSSDPRVLVHQAGCPSGVRPVK